MTDKKKPNVNKSVTESNEIVASNRRDAVKNILAGSTLAVGAVTSNVWVKPVVDAVVTPAHAQTSTTVIVTGNAAVTIVGGGVAPARSILDLFVESAHAAPAYNFDGACMTMTIDLVAKTVSVVTEFFSGSSLVLSGSISAAGAFNFSGSGVNVDGSYNSANGSASGTVNNGSDEFTFLLSDDNSSCTPIAPSPTTTAYPTTTGYATTTAYATTTGYPTTTTETPTTTPTVTTTSIPFDAG